MVEVLKKFEFEGTSEGINDCLHEDLTKLFNDPLLKWVNAEIMAALVDGFDGSGVVLLELIKKNLVFGGIINFESGPLQVIVEYRNNPLLIDYLELKAEESWQPTFYRKGVFSNSNWLRDQYLDQVDHIRQSNPLATYAIIMQT